MLYCVTHDVHIKCSVGLHRENYHNLSKDHETDYVDLNDYLIMIKLNL